MLKLKLTLMLKLIWQNKTVHKVNIQQVISSLRMGNYVCERKTKEQSDENNKITYLAGWEKLPKTFPFPPRFSNLSTCTWPFTCSGDLRSITKVSSHFEGKPQCILDKIDLFFVSEVSHVTALYAFRSLSQSRYFDVIQTDLCSAASSRLEQATVCVLTSRIGSFEQFVK